MQSATQGVPSVTADLATSFWAGSSPMWPQDTDGCAGPDESHHTPCRRLGGLLQLDEGSPVLPVT